MESRTPAPASDRGAILVHTALAILALVAFTTFVVDYGTFWLSRRQAQNAADAGALAGAYALISNSSDFTVTGPARMNAQHIGQKNWVYGQQPAIDISADIEFMCPDGTKCARRCPDGSANTCIKVDAYRTTAKGNPLPVFFGTLVGLTAQGIRATATAQMGGANAARCVLPFVLADRWADNYDEAPVNTFYTNDSLPGVDGWTNNDLYQEPQGDVYTPPYHSGHTGWTVSGDYGRQLVLHPAVNQFSAGWANVVNLPGMGTGGDEFRDAIRGCAPNSPTVAIATETEDCSAYTDPSGTSIAEALAGCLGSETGGKEGPTKQGVENNGGGPSLWGPIISQDSVSWSTSVNAGPQGQVGGVVDAFGNLKMDSPRIRPVPVFDIDHYMSNPGCKNLGGSGCVAKVVNIIGVFVEGLCTTVQAAGQLQPGNSCQSGPGEHPDSQVVVRIVTMPGKYLSSGGGVVEESVFLKFVSLIR
jgi:Flp pilus assembly protein TadG